MELKMMDTMHIWIAHEFPVYARDRAGARWTKCQRQLLHFSMWRPSRKAANGPAGSHGESSKYEHWNDGFAYERDNDSDNAEE